jgi:predicted aconitase with swiveling domain/8-oxo-dGTP pyrophosphatase MutT (NUDIX family)
MKIKAKGIGHGRAESDIVVSQLPISFLGGVDPAKGAVVEASSDIKGKSFAGKVLAFPHGKGSTVGSYVIFQLKKSGTAPAAILNHKAEAIVATGAILAGIPMLTGIPVDVLKEGDRAIVDADEGTIEISDVEERTVVTVIAKKGDKVLVLKRSGKVSTYKGRWAGVSGGLLPGEEPLEAAMREMKEETGLSLRQKEIAVRVEPIYARDNEVLWEIHPFLAEIQEESITLNWEHDEYRWVSPAEVGDYQTVPKLDKVIESLLKGQSNAEKKVC